MGTANSTLNATKLDAEGANMIIEIKKEETKEPEMDWSGQGSREELKVPWRLHHIYEHYDDFDIKQIWQGTVCKEDLERSKQAVTEATEVKVTLEMWLNFFESYHRKGSHTLDERSLNDRFYF